LFVVPLTFNNRGNMQDTLSLGWTNIWFFNRMMFFVTGSSNTPNFPGLWDAECIFRWNRRWTTSAGGKLQTNEENYEPGCHEAPTGIPEQKTTLSPIFWPRFERCVYLGQTGPRQIWKWGRFCTKGGWKIVSQYRFPEWVFFRLRAAVIEAASATSVLGVGVPDQTLPTTPGTGSAWYQLPLEMHWDGCKDEAG
jgi:hypothetical protein